MEDKYFCRSCKGLRKYKVIFEEKRNGSEALDYIRWSDNYYIIECLGCETVSFLRIYGDSEMILHNDDGEMEYFDKVDIYPSFLEKGEEIKTLYYLPDKIGKIYAETICAFKISAYILTAGGFRAIIEGLCNHLEIRKDNLSKRIDLLHEKGFLSLNESKRLHTIRFLGNDALHEMETPKKEQLLILLEIINHLLENLFIQDKKIEDNIDTVIDNYKGFLKLIRNKITEEQIGKELTLNEILGKSTRLIKTSLLKGFENQFLQDVEKSNIEYLALATKDEVIFFKIEKLPEFSFF